MGATYEALCEVGYSDLTAQAIADRTDRSKAALFYHYDSLDALVADFIEYLLEGFDSRVARTRDWPPLERLAAIVDWFLSGADDEQLGFHTALLELRAQAPYNDAFRDKLRESDDRLRGALEEILRDGIEEGVFRDHDPAAVSALLLAAFDGARIRQFTLGRDEYLETVKAGAVDRIVADILAPGVEFPADVDVEFPPDDRLSHGAGESTTDGEPRSDRDGGPPDD